MKNPFRFFRSKHDNTPDSPAAVEEQKEQEALVSEPDILPEPEIRPEPQASFIEWCRTRVQGGIERRERNDIYEEYSVYGTDENEKLLCRYYHRYPEHERDFDLSYTRSLSFTEFNRRLLAELDKGSIALSDYNACIFRAEELLSLPHENATAYEGFNEEETAVLHDFCESMDNLIDKEYRSGEGIFRCSCNSVVGDQSLSLWFRKPLSRDAFDEDIPGVKKQAVEGYDIDDIWIMGVYNRLTERCGHCAVTQLTSQWSLNQESVLLMISEHFPGIEGAVMIAVADPADMARFGFYSLDFSRK